jgi:hypothetical protein
MKYLTIVIDPIKIKGDPDDEQQLQADLHEKLQTMIEAETLTYTIQDDEEDEDYERD